jgi:hypothetical protein
MSTVTIWYLLVRNDFSGLLKKNSTKVIVSDSADIAELIEEIRKKESFIGSNIDFDVWKLVTALKTGEARRTVPSLKRYDDDDDDSEVAEQKAKEMYSNDHNRCAWRVSPSTSVKRLGKCEAGYIGVLIQVPAYIRMSYPLYLAEAYALQKCMSLLVQMVSSLYIKSHSLAESFHIAVQHVQSAQSHTVSPTVGEEPVRRAAKRRREGELVVECVHKGHVKSFCRRSGYSSQ